jgi:hypothetical protein
MHQLVPDHVVRVREVAGEGQDHARPQPLGEAAGPLADQAPGDRRLLEVRLVGVEDQRLPLGELASEDQGEPVVPALRHAGGLLDGCLLFGIEVDVEVLRLEDLPFEPLIDDLVAAEVLGGRTVREENQRDERQCQRKHYPAGMKRTGHRTSF